MTDGGPIELRFDLARPREGHHHETFLRPLYEVLERMRGQPEASFVWPNRDQPYHVAARMKIRVSVTKLSGEGFRVWRLPDNAPPSKHGRRRRV